MRVLVTLFLAVVVVESKPFWFDGWDKTTVQSFDNTVYDIHNISKLEYTIDPDNSTGRDLDDFKKRNNFMSYVLHLRNHKKLDNSSNLISANNKSKVVEDDADLQELKAISSNLTNLANISLSQRFNYTPNLTEVGNVLNETATNETSVELIRNETLVNNFQNSSKEAQVEGASDEESSEESSEEQGGIGGLVSGFLSGFSKPDGGVDVEAIASLLGSLSTQNDDGTYDFSGITELLMNLFGGDEEGGGGSDVGAFAGGLLGAIIKGVAKPPGAKGAGIFTAKVLGGILPALSGPAPPKDEMMDKPPPALDSGGFLSGLLKTFLSGFSGNGQGGGSKFSIIKSIVSLITSTVSSFSAASSDSSKSKW